MEEALNTSIVPAVSFPTHTLLQIISSYDNKLRVVEQTQYKECKYQLANYTAEGELSLKAETETIHLITIPADNVKLETAI